MIFSLQLQISLMRYFRCIKTTFTNMMSVDHNLNTPFTLMCRYSKKTRFVGFSWMSHVLKISESCNFSKIFKSVVLFISVFMINMTSRKTSGHVKPCKPVSKSFLIIDSNRPISCISWTTCNLSYKVWTTGVGFPNKNARDRIIIKNGLDMVSCNHECQFTIKAA